MGFNPDDQKSHFDGQGENHGRYAREDAGSNRHAFRYGSPKNVIDLATVTRISNHSKPCTSEAHETDLSSRYSDHRYGDDDSERYSSSSSRYVQGEMEEGSRDMSRTNRFNDEPDYSLSSDEKNALALRQRRLEQRHKFYSGPVDDAAPVKQNRRHDDQNH